MKIEPVSPPTLIKTGWKCIDDRTLTADMLRGDKEAQEAFINALTPAELDALPFDWGFWARDDQLPPRDWITDGRASDHRSGENGQVHTSFVMRCNGRRGARYCD